MPYFSGFPRMLLSPGDRFIKKVVSKTVIGPYAPTSPVITKNARVASIGSCFAEEISKVLRQRNLDVQYLFMDETWNSAFALELFLAFIVDGKKSAFSKRLALNLQIDDERRAIIRERLARSDIVILTFGLSLCWFDQAGDLLLKYLVPDLPPEDLKADMQSVVMRQTTVDQNITAILNCIELIKKLASPATIVLTLSPVPLTGALTDVTSVPANAISKATLRLALDSVFKRAIDKVYYWPSYEIVTWYGGHVERAFGDVDRDSRHVRQPVIDLIADQFISHYVVHE